MCNYWFVVDLRSRSRSSSYNIILLQQVIVASSTGRKLIPNSIPQYVTQKPTFFRTSYNTVSYLNFIDYENKLFTPLNCQSSKTNTITQLFLLVFASRELSIFRENLVESKPKVQRGVHVLFQVNGSQIFFIFCEIFAHPPTLIHLLAYRADDLELV